MNDETRNKPAIFPRFPTTKFSKKALLLAILGILLSAALLEFLISGYARRTFVFHTIEGRLETVEERNMRVSEKNPMYSSSREINISRYVEDAILGPISPDSLPLFPRETRLLSLFYRDGVVYVNFSEEAAMLPMESLPLHGFPLQNEGVFANMETLHLGIIRNFPYVQDTRFFIDGKAVFTDISR